MERIQKMKKHFSSLTGLAGVSAFLVTDLYTLYGFRSNVEMMLSATTSIFIFREPLIRIQSSFFRKDCSQPRTSSGVSKKAILSPGNPFFIAPCAVDRERDPLRKT